VAVFALRASLGGRFATFRVVVVAGLLPSVRRGLSPLIWRKEARNSLRGETVSPKGVD
jgi:hypothetical protein